MVTVSGLLENVFRNYETLPIYPLRVGYVGLKLSEMLYMTQKDIRQSLVLNSEKKRKKVVKRRGFDNMILLIY